MVTYASNQDTADVIESSKLPTALHLANALEQTMQWPLHGKAADELRRLHQVNQDLLEALRDARDCLGSWGDYASPYFQKKHDLKGDIERAQAAIEAALREQNT